MESDGQILAPIGACIETMATDIANIIFAGCCGYDDTAAKCAGIFLGEFVLVLVLQRSTVCTLIMAAHIQRQAIL
jgi:hypothetical protein